VYIKLKDALRVISHYFPEMASIGSNMLLRETTSSPVTIVKQASVAFGCGQTVWTKHVRLDETNSRTEFEDWDEIEPSRRKQVKCIAFPEFVLKDSDSYDEENSDGSEDYVNAEIERRAADGTVTVVRLYNELIHRKWKGYRVLNSDWAIFSDSEDETEDGVVLDAMQERELRIKRARYLETEAEVPEERWTPENAWPEDDSMIPREVLSDTTSDAGSDIVDMGLEQLECDEGSDKENENPYMDVFAGVASDEGVCCMCGGECNPASQACGGCARGGYN
jgi:hypothetical protein